MTFYLGLKLVENTGFGIADIVNRLHRSSGVETNKTRTKRGDPADVQEMDRLLNRAIQPIKGFSKASFLPMGEPRRLYGAVEESEITKTLKLLLRNLLEKHQWIIVDCRGGIDQDSLEICKAVDDILLVVETDTTSFQATQYLVDVLSNHDLLHKLRGFFINKVFDNPNYIARTGTSVFRTQYLSSIPFDLEATRNFLVGDVPLRNSLFGIHLWRERIRHILD